LGAGEQLKAAELLHLQISDQAAAAQKIL